MIYNPFLVLFHKYTAFVYKNGSLMIFLLCTLFFISNSRKAIFNFLTSCAISLLICFIIKYILKFPLPISAPYQFTQEEWNKTRLITYSMPSGHISLLSSLLFGFLLQVNKFVSKRDFYFISFFIISFLLIKSYITVYLGYHYFADVIIAFILMGFLAFILDNFLFKIKNYITISKIIIIFLSIVSFFVHDQDFMWLYLFVFIILIPKKQIK